MLPSDVIIERSEIGEIVSAKDASIGDSAEIVVSRPIAFEGEPDGASSADVFLLAVHSLEMFLEEEK